MATSRLSLVSRARYTSPMPPAPSSDTTSYEPTCWPGERGMLGCVDYGSQIRRYDDPHRERTPPDASAQIPSSHVRPDCADEPCVVRAPGTPSTFCTRAPGTPSTFC